MTQQEVSSGLGPRIPRDLPRDDLPNAVDQLFAASDHETHSIMYYYMMQDRERRGGMVSDAERTAMAAAYGAVLRARTWGEQSLDAGRQVQVLIPHAYDSITASHVPGEVPDMAGLPEAPVSPPAGYVGDTALALAVVHP